MELWHALNHSIEGRDLFLDSRDYARFVHNLYEFNSTAPAGNAYRLFDPSGMMDLRCPSFSGKERELLVEIHGWTLMKDHYHLVLSELVENGVTMFLRKINVGYAKYVNERYGRSGTLFKSRTKKILIEDLPHFLYILHYIHLNPLDYLQGTKEWRVRSKGGIKSTREALAFLASYRWSSYLDYAGKKNFPSLIDTTLFKESFDDYQASLEEYLYDAEYDEDMTKMVLE